MFELLYFPKQNLESQEIHIPHNEEGSITMCMLCIAIGRAHGGFFFAVLNFKKMPPGKKCGFFCYLLFHIGTPIPKNNYIGMYLFDNHLIHGFN